MSKKALYTFSAIFFVVVLGFVTFPFSTKLIDKVEPYIFGVPMMQFCMLFSAFALAIWLAIWLALEGKIEARQRAEEKEEVTG